MFHRQKKSRITSYLRCIAHLASTNLSSLHCTLHALHMLVTTCTCLRVRSSWYEYAWFETVTWAIPGYARACRRLWYGPRLFIYPRIATFASAQSPSPRTNFYSWLCLNPIDKIMTGKLVYEASLLFVLVGPGMSAGLVLRSHCRTHSHDCHGQSFAFIYRMYHTVCI